MIERTLHQLAVATLATVLITVGALSARADEPADGGRRPKLLVIINGESNSGGFALNSEATAEELATRSAVQILDNDALVFRPLDIGTNNLLGHAGLKPTETHGFELELANRAERLPKESLPVYLVKTGQGGSRIAEWAADGRYFQTFRSRIAAAKRLLADEQVRTVILFSLGINDAIAGTPLEQWKPAVEEHLARLRKEIGGDTPIVMTRFMPRYAAYNAAIEELCTKVPGTSSVDTLDAPLRDPNHWSYAGMKLVAGRMLDRVAGLGLMPQAADATPAANQTSRRLSYTRDIQPILATHCFNCHGLDEHSREAGLRLDLRESALAALDSGMRAIVPGKIAESELVPRITSTDADTVMPPPAFKKPLSPQQIELLQQWIAQGAGYEPHWAFQPVQRPAVPAPAAGPHAGWPRNAIDQFVLARLAQEKLAPAAEASREAWLRRVSLDLTGLPPTPDERATFLADQSAGAHGQVVDRLLASPRHAERMALQWLDVARYADTNGYNNDEERTQWPWRDWVIDAFARNMPYDRFIVEQLAGDLLPDAGRPQRIATGFGRNHVLTTEGGIIPEEYRVEYVADRIQTAATAFMGLTLQCARCHDHKFDPISQRDYYRLFAFFNNIPDPPVAYASKKFVRVGEPTIALRNYADESELAALLAAKAELKAALPAKDAGKPDAVKTDGVKPEPTKAEADAMAARLKQVEERIEAIETRTTRVMVMADLDTPRQAHVLNRGQYDQPRDAVEPGVPAWLPPLPAGVAANRLALARWLVDPRHPLTARVAVNRWWEMLFGRGLVETVEDFGAQGSPPTHPELLDHLASDLIEGGWNMRSILKSIVLSATYRQAAEAAPEAFARDPDNRLLARGPRFRLPAEMVRDQALFAGGLLVERVGGPSVKPFQPAGLWEEVSVLHQATYVPDSGDGLHRRSLYTFWKRTCPPPALAVFDAPDRETCVIRRSRTSTPLQALVLMNDPTYVEAARGVALRAIALADRSSASTGDPARRDREIIAHACRLVLARDAAPREIDLLLTKLHEFRRHFQGDAEAARRLVAINDAQDCPLPPDELAAWTVVGSTLLCLDETISKN